MLKKLNQVQKDRALSMGFQTMFAERETMDEAEGYFQMVLDTLRDGDKMAVITAFNVMRNTEIYLKVQSEEEVTA